MHSTKTLVESQPQAPLAALAAKLPDGSEKSSSPSHSFTSTTAASPPPNDGKSAMRTTEMVANGRSRRGAEPLGQLMAQLQRSVGNARVSSLVGRKIQTKLNVTAVNDPSEREADHVAEAVTQGPATQNVSPAKEVKPEAGLHAARTIQRTARSGATGKDVDAKMESRIKSPSGGQHLPGELQQEMEGHLGADFSQVRVHESAVDQADAERLNAKAFTHGQDIWLGAGASVDDRKLMAHELTHVVQQTGADVSRSPAIQRTLKELDEELDNFNVDEDNVIDLLGGLTASEKAIVLSGTSYRDLIASALNFDEMEQAVGKLNPPLSVKLDWLRASSLATRFISYSDIQDIVKAAPESERLALATPAWQDFFVTVCGNSTILEAVEDLHFPLVTKLEWVKDEASTIWLDYSDIQSMVTSATQAERDVLNTDDWKDFFIDVCDNSTILKAVTDLNFELERKLEWVELEAATYRLDYSDIQQMVKDATQPQRDKLKTDHWREFFVGVCTDETMAKAVVDLGWNLKEKMEWMRAEDPAADPKQVKFIGSHTMISGGEGPPASDTWENGDDEHAVAYTMLVEPRTTTQFTIDKELQRVIGKPLTVRVSAKGSIIATVSGLVMGKGTLDVVNLDLKALPDSQAVGVGNYELDWELSEDNTVWAPLGKTGKHMIYWLKSAPGVTPLDTRAAEKVTKYAAGLSDKGAIAAAIRHGPRGIDKLSYSPSDDTNSDPLTVYDDGVGICTDYSNLLTLLALSVGLSANTVFFFGGFQTLGKNVWTALSGAYGTTLINVKSPVPGYNVIMLPGVSPGGWAFTFHAISRIEGTLQDAALDRKGIDAEAINGGRIVHLVELSGAGLPDASAGSAYSTNIPRKDHTVEVSIRDYGNVIPDSAFGADRYPLDIAASDPDPLDVLIQCMLTDGTLPPGLTMNSDGRITGTPTAPGTFAFKVKIETKPGAAIENIVSLTITVG